MIRPNFGRRGRPAAAGTRFFNAYAEYTPLNYQNLTFPGVRRQHLDETYTGRATYGQNSPPGRAAAPSRAGASSSRSGPEF